MDMSTPERTTYVTVRLTLADVQHIRNLLQYDLIYYPKEHPQYLEGKVQCKLVEDALDAAV